MKKRLLVVFPVLVVLGAVAAFAYWMAFGTGSGAATVGTLNAPTNANAATANSTTSGPSPVSLSWAASAGGVTPTGYYVTRIKNSNSSTADACGTSSSSTTGSTSCSDTSVPDGTYHYTVTAVYHSWTATSAASNDVTVVNVTDASAPTASLTFPTGGGRYNAFAYNNGCLPAGICGSASDASGVQSVRVSIKRDSDGSYWTGSAFSGTSETFNAASLLSQGATSTDWDYDFSLPADGTYTVHVQTDDTVGNTQSGSTYAATATFLVDATPPTTTDDTASIGNGWKKTNQTVTLTATDGSGSGVAATYYTSDGTAPTTSSSTGTSVALTSDGLYTVKYFSVDQVANAESVKTAGTQVRIDKTNPTPGATSFAGAFVSGGTSYIKNGQALTNAATDPTVNGASSGVASVHYFYCAGSCTPSPGNVGTTEIGAGSTSGPSYSVNWSAQPADGTYSVLARVTDTAGNSADAAVKTVVVDNSPPATTDNSASIGNGWKNTSQTVTLSPSDGSGSGVSKTYYTDGSTTPTTSSSQGTSITLASDGLFNVKYFSVDNLGNQEAVEIAGTQIRIDKTNPSVAAGATNADTSSYTAGTWTNQTVTVHYTCSDPIVNGATSGIASCTNDQTFGSNGTTASTSGSATDNAGNSGSVSFGPIKIDKTAPAVTITQVNGSTVSFPYATNAAGGVTSIGGTCGTAAESSSSSADSATVSWSIGVRSGTASCTANAWSSGPFTAITAEGSYNAQVSQGDAAGNTGTDNKSVIVDRTAPTNVLSLVNQSTQAGPASSTNAASFLSGATLWYAGGTNGSFKLQNAVSDPLSGPASSTFGSLAGTTAGWTFTGSTVSTPSVGPYVSNQLSWTANTNSPSENVTGTDAAGNTNTGTALTFRNDSTAPTAAIAFPAASGSYRNATWSGTVSGTATDPGTNGTNPPSFGSATSAANGSGGANTLLINTPTSVTSGDVLIAAVTIDSGNSTTITAPSGWTAIQDLNNGSSVRVASYYHVVAGSEPGSYSWGFGGTVTASGGIVRYTGVDTANPIDVSSAGTGNSGTPTATSVTTSAANDLIVGVFGIAGNATFTAPSGMLERYDVTNAGAGGPATEAADVTQASVGASGDKIATASSSARWVGQLVALRAAPPNISGLGKVQVSVQATSGATSGKYWDPAANGGVGGFTGSNELLLPATGTSSWSLAFPSSNFTDGTYTVKAYAIDNVGNFAGVSAANVTIDNVAPTPTLTAPTGGSVTSNTRPTFSGVAGTASGDLTAITVKVYNGTGTGGTVAQTLSATASAGTWSVTPTAAQALADGIYTAQASQSDTVGNSGTSAAVTFTVNTAAPSITATPSSPSANTAPTISFGHGVYSSFQCSLDGAPFAACASPKALSGLGNGSHTFSVKALDSQSNATQTASYTWTVDTSAPTISAKPANPSAATSPSFSFSQPSYTSYECSLDGAAFASCTSPKSYSTTDGSHTFSVKAIDADGIRTSAASYTWTQTTTAPSITAKPTSTSASKTPSFSFSETGYSAFQCQVDSGGFASCASPFTTATLADGAHSFNVRAVDGNGVSTAAATYGWTVNSTAPTITSNSGLTAGGTYASTSASFSFSHAVYSAFQCFLEGGSFGVCAVPTNFTGLADGTHTLTAAATDADNVRTSSSTFSWTVKNAAPTISSQPANPTNTTNGSFSFSEPPFTSFECKVDAGSFAACTSPFSTGALSGSGQTGTSHSFQVHALDTLNNQTQNQSATWTIDTTAPTLGAISDSSSASNRDTISGSTNENGGTVTVRIYTGTSTTGTPVQTYTTTTYGGSSPAFTWSITTKSNDLNGGSQYTAVATQADAAGNASTNSRSVTFNAH